MSIRLSLREQLRHRLEQNITQYEAVIDTFFGLIEDCMMWDIEDIEYFAEGSYGIAPNIDAAIKDRVDVIKDHS